MQALHNPAMLPMPWRVKTTMGEDDAQVTAIASEGDAAALESAANDMAGAAARLVGWGEMR